MTALRRGREGSEVDERTLRSGPFVEALRQEVTQAVPTWPRAQAVAALSQLIAAVAATSL